MKDLLLLSTGGFIQWMFSTILTRLVVVDNPTGVFAATFIAQSIWWINIQQTTRSNDARRWLSWSLGASMGAAAGLMICRYCLNG